MEGVKREELKNTSNNGVANKNPSSSVQFSKSETPNLQKREDDVWSSELSTKVSGWLNWGKKVAEQYTKAIKEGYANQEPQMQNDHDLKKQGNTSNQFNHSSDYIPRVSVADAPSSAFALGDDEENEFKEESEAYQGEEDTQNLVEEEEEEKVVKISELLSLGNIHIFSCKARLNRKLFEQRYIIVGENMIMSLKAHPTMLGYGIIIWKRTLRHLVRLAYHKENNKVMTFVVKGTLQHMLYVPEESQETFQETYLIQDPLKFTQIVRENTSKLKKKLSQQKNNISLASNN